MGKKLTGGDIVCEALLNEGVDIVFGLPGGAILPLYGVLGRYPDLRHVLVRHEQGAAHAADGYARASGKVGVAFATSGPGATNLITGLATAMMDSVPIVAITGQVGRAAIGTDAFQETDITGATRQAFLCVADYEEDFTFACTTPPADGTQWYTVCGKPHASYAAHAGGVGGLALLGLAVFATLFGLRRM